MTEIIETGKREAEPTQADRVVALASSHAVVAAARPKDPRGIRRAELKKQKRRAHRRRINAANRPG